MLTLSYISELMSAAIYLSIYLSICAAGSIGEDIGSTSWQAVSTLCGHRLVAYITKQQINLKR